jgi:hypothetical protein
MFCLIAPSYDCVNHSTNSASAMAVNARMTQGKYSSMVFMIVIGLPRNERIENGAKNVEDQHDYGDEAEDAHSASTPLAQTAASRANRW